MKADILLRAGRRGEAVAKLREAPEQPEHNTPAGRALSAALPRSGHAANTVSHCEQILAAWRGRLPARRGFASMSGLRQPQAGQTQQAPGG
jgi:hypothetical protein